MNEKRRALFWEGSSKKDFKEFPVPDAVHVLHAFQKKSKTGISTPKRDVDLIESRLKAVLARYGLGGR